MDPMLEQDIPYIPVFIGFAILLVLTTLLQRKLRNRFLAQQGQVDSKDIPSIEQRLAANKTWRSGKIQSEGRGPVIALWTLSIVWCLTFGAAFFNNLSNPEMKTGGLVALGLFTLCGAVPIYFAVRFSIRQFKFGNSYCFIDGKAGVLDKPITGVVRTKSNVNPTGDYTVEIACLELYHTGSGKDRKSSTRSHWQGRQRVSKEGINSVAGIPFSIMLPKSPPETGEYITDGRINWQIKISAPTDGVDYSAMFVVPVFRMDYTI